MDPALHLLAEGDPGDEVAAVLRRTSVDAALPDNVRIIAEFGMLATCRLRREEIVSTRLADGVASLKAPVALVPEWAINESDDWEDGKFDDERRTSSPGATGKGTVVGIVDWGCDFAHEDFRTPDGATRLLALWDQTQSATGPGGNIYGYGRTFGRHEIDQALRSENPYSALGYHPEDGDPDRSGAHGTHVLSIAAGTGGAENPGGMAPDADLIFVHFGSRDGEPIGDSVSLLEAIDFIARTAGDRPLVINLSIGRHGGPHDGSSLVEQAIDQFVQARPGRAVVQSAGNYFSKDVHVSGRVRPNACIELSWDIDPDDRTPNELDLWYSGRDRLRVEVVSPSGEKLAAIAPNEQAELRHSGRRVGQAFHRQGDPNNGDNQIAIYLDKDAKPGRWQVRLCAIDVVDGRFHAWVERDLACPGCQSRFAAAGTSLPPSTTTTTGTICNGMRSITVGAFNRHDPSRPLAPFSSSGPTRDGRIKPDLVAPGVRILAARSASRTPGKPRLCRKSGTSMAAPYVTGTIACLFEAAGRLLTIDETRKILLANVEPASANVDDEFRIGSGWLDSTNILKGLETGLGSHGDRADAPDESTAVAKPLGGDVALHHEIEHPVDLHDVNTDEQEYEAAMFEDEFTYDSEGMSPWLDVANSLDTEPDLDEPHEQFWLDPEFEEMHSGSSPLLEYAAEAERFPGVKRDARWLSSLLESVGTQLPAADRSVSPALLFDSLTIGKRPEIAAAVQECFEVVGQPGEQLADDGDDGWLVLTRGEAGLGVVDVVADRVRLERYLSSNGAVHRDALILQPATAADGARALWQADSLMAQGARVAELSSTPRLWHDFWASEWEPESHVPASGARQWASNLDAARRAAGEGAGQMVMRAGRIARPEFKLRSSETTAANNVITTLRLNDAVFVERALKGRPQDTLSWYYVYATTANGTPYTGWLRSDGVLLDPPEPEAKVHFVQAGEKLIDIAAKYYKPAQGFEWGDDARFYVAALAFVNKGYAGLIFPRGWTDEDFRRRAGWKEIHVKAGHAIWIPSMELLQPLKGHFVSSGSITYEIWLKVKRLARKAWEWVVYGAASIAGILHGALESVYDVFAGAVDLIKSVWGILKSLFTGNFIKDAKELWEAVKQLDLSQMAEDFLNKWNAEDPWDRGYFRGRVVGYVIAEILMAVFSVGITTAIKWLGKAGKFAKVTMLLAKSSKFQSIANTSNHLRDLSESAIRHLKKRFRLDPDVPTPRRRGKRNRVRLYGDAKPERVSKTIKLSDDTAGTGGVKRIWADRHPDGTIEFRIDGELKTGLPRKDPRTPNFQNDLPLPGEIGLGAVRRKVPVWRYDRKTGRLKREVLDTKDGYQRSHLWGPGFGDEAREGIMYAPASVNLGYLNAGIEDRLRELHKLAEDYNTALAKRLNRRLKDNEKLKIEVTATARSYPPSAWAGPPRKPWFGHELLKEAEYEFRIRLPDGTARTAGRVEIKVPPPGASVSPSISVSPGDAGVWSLL